VSESSPDAGPGGSAAGEAAPVASERRRSGNNVPEPAVTGMFDSIAPVYDRMNTLMTAGMDGRWRRAAVKAANLSRGGVALDVACGTGKLTAALAAAVGPMGRVTGIDLSPAMLDEARRAFGDLVQIEFLPGNALALPVPDGAFDAATIAFGLRNLAGFEDGFREMARVVRSGGRVVCLELTMPRPRWAGRMYWWTFRHAAPAIGTAFGKRDAYTYLPNSLDGFPEADELAESMRRVGLKDVSVRRLGFGAVALHVGTVA
jgi:demethylmenaquinone methyltransferase / 2-methoxy-6-polyprenyl-1,4-benzoquinol methylase